MYSDVAAGCVTKTYRHNTLNTTRVRLAQEDDTMQPLAHNQTPKMVQILTAPDRRTKSAAVSCLAPWMGRRKL